MPARHYLLFLLLLFGSVTCAPTRAQSFNVETLTVRADRPTNVFRPDGALGAGVDGMERGDVARVYTPANIAAMRSAGLRPLAYRLRTELGVEAWHWNPAGGFSDASHRRGYWTSDAVPRTAISASNGYSLPRRGSTGDQANDHGYSRVDDGSPATFWKSNPYLDQRYTGDENRLHPQWVLVDFAHRVPVSSLRIHWGEPYARSYRVEYWRGTDPADPQELPDDSGWAPFEWGDVEHGTGGIDMRRLSPHPISARWLRVLMTESSGTAPPGALDPRDRLGFAIREIYVGTLEGSTFRDRIAHGRRTDRQTRIYASSTDPWHSATDLDRGVEQPGFDRVIGSGLANGLPVLMPVALLYDTPENAAAQIKWLEARGCPLRQIEIGEEPDGQFMAPEDYAALYLQWATAIHAVDPRLKLGGPGFQTALYGWQFWPDEHGNTSWMGRFLAYLRERHRLADFAFFSFEWYPFDRVGMHTGAQLALAPTLLRNAIFRLRDEGVPRNIPWIITEYGYSSFAGEPEVDLPGALLNAETVAQFLTLGGSAAYLYGYEPNVPILEDGATVTWGNLALFLSDNERRVRCPLPAYYGAVLLAQRWAQPGDGLHQVFATEPEAGSGHGARLVTAYAVRRPDGRTAVLLLNKDPVSEHRVRVLLRSAGADSAPFPAAEAWQYSPAQYAWHAAGEHGHPLRNQPPAHAAQTLAGEPLRLPPYSLTVLRTL